MSSNAKTGSASKIKMESFDDLFGGSGAQETGAEQIINAPLADLYEFKDHPFKMLDDEKMEETTESIRLYGVLVPGIARPRDGGGYELIAGHRRKHGSERAGKTEMPIIVRNYSDDEATIIMVDSNIQREDILPSEKAKAYKMKYEAMKHQGKKSGKNTLDEVGEAAGENAKKVQRYIWLARLSDVLLEMVDTKKLGFSQGVDISFLSEEAQQWVEVIIEEQGCNVSTVQSGKLKEYGKSGELNYTDLSYNNQSNQSESETEETIDAMEDVNAYIEIIKENIEYDHYMKYSDWQDRELYDELFEIICEVVCVKHKTVRIGGDDYPYELVKSKFLKLNSSHLNYVIGCMKNITTKITNIKAYMVTTLYNAPSTINHYYQQEVQHDMYGGGWHEKGIV